MRMFLRMTLWIVGLVIAGCGGENNETAPPAQGASAVASAVATTTHLTLALADADVTSAASPAADREPRVWTFEKGPGPWRPVTSNRPYVMKAELSKHEDALRLVVPGDAVAGMYLELPDLRLRDWETVVVEAQTSDRFAGLLVEHGIAKTGAIPGPWMFMRIADNLAPVFGDGSLQRYAIPLRAREGNDSDATIGDLAILFATFARSEVTIRSVTLMPRGSAYRQDYGTRHVTVDDFTYDAIFAHTPATIDAPVTLHESTRLDFALAVAPGDEVRYRIAIDVDGERSVVFDELVRDASRWHPRSVDLVAALGNREGDAQATSVEVGLVLEARSETPGSVALFGAPIVSNRRAANHPDVIFYVIDGGDADFMSLYEYERETTPFLEKLAAEGVLFTRAYSNATWTQPSTVSFMTGLQHSVLGGLRRGLHSTAVPEGAVTMADHFRAAGYATASFTANPNAGRIIGIDQGIDVMRDAETKHHSTSSIDLHEHFFRFRDAYPAGPHFVHFQTTDVHEPNDPVKPFAGRFVSSDERRQLGAWDGKIWQSAGEHFGTTSVSGFYDIAIEQAGVDRKRYFDTRRGLYDETMAHQDHALEQFIARLKKDGTWSNTILVIASDHGHPAGTFARFGRGAIDPQPEPWQGALFDAYATRVPMLVLWPGKLEGGRRIDTPVSMIDVLPTLLDLVDLPEPMVCQGRSLEPLLRGEPFEGGPVVLDEFRVDEATGEWIGNLEIIDGRFGASLEIAPVLDDADPKRGRHSVPAGGRWGAVHPYFPEVPRLLLYDLEKDPFTLRAVNEQHPELVEKYEKTLRELWDAHRALATRFEDAEAEAMTPGQLEMLRKLGYIR